MIEISPQFIKTDSGELVVITRAEFDALMISAAEAGEDADDIAIFDSRMEDLKKGTNQLLPQEVSASMLRGDSLFKSLRNWRRVTKVQLSSMTGLSLGHIGDLESRRRIGTPDAVQRIAKALDVDPNWLA